MIKRSLISVLIALLPHLTLSQTYSGSIIASKSDTTADGRVFYNDLVLDSVQGELFRTDRVGMDIIREINADRKKHKRLADSLQVKTSLLKENFDDCMASNNAITFQNDILKDQLDISDQMLIKESKRNDLADKTIKSLNRKVVVGKIGWTVGGVFIGTTIVLGTLLLIR